jgi:hypothetical protein
MGRKQTLRYVRNGWKAGIDVATILRFGPWMAEASKGILSAPTPQAIVMDYVLHARCSARLRVACGDQEFTIPDFGSMTDGLGDLVRAALAIATGEWFIDVLFDAEPRIWGLALEPAGLSDDKMRIARITIKDGGTSLKDEGHSGQPVWKWSSEPVLEGFDPRGTVRVVGTALCRRLG